MGRVSQWAVRRPWYALLSWVGIMIVVGLLGARFGGDYNDNFELPDTESTTAQELLAGLSGGGAGTGAGLEGQVVWRPVSGQATDASAKVTMTELLTQLSRSSGVSCVLTPFAEPVGTGCPEQPAEQSGGGAEAEQPPMSPEAESAQAHFGQSGLSPDGTVAYATVMFEGQSFDDLNTDDVVAALDLIKAQNGADGLQVGANGVFAFVGGEPPSSETIGVTVALVILLFAFGSILGAFLPIVSAVLSVALTTTFVLPLVARYFDVATFAPILASMIGLGVGIDYSLFVINRYREAIIHGRSSRDAALESVRTSGRAVQFAAANGDHRPARPVRHADHVLQRHRGLGRRHRPHGDGRGAAAPACRAVHPRHLGVRRPDGLDHRSGGDPQAASDGRVARAGQGLPVPRLDHRPSRSP